jgi:hypothetical protein
VKFLIASGQPKFAQLLASIKTGKSTDQALQGVYGFDRTGLYNAWRDSVHLSGSGATNPPAAVTAAATTPAANANQAAGNPAANTNSQPSRAGQGNEPVDNGTTVLLLTLGAALLLLLIAAVVAFALVLSRRSHTV